MATPGWGPFHSGPLSPECPLEPPRGEPARRGPPAQRSFRPREGPLDTPRSFRSQNHRSEGSQLASKIWRDSTPWVLMPLASEGRSVIRRQTWSLKPGLHTRKSVASKKALRAEQKEDRNLE